MSTKKIFENYFKQNRNTDEEIAKLIADIVNEALNALPDDSPIKNRKAGLEIMSAVRERLSDSLKDEVEFS
tara:strand:- start:435 stop:647 length:213 start_codon:yes stop_codon:yes gene_type:complete